MRTTLVHLTDEGTIGKEKRGGRPKKPQEDKKRKDEILTHINRSPRMESHYTRQDSKRDYLTKISIKR